MKKQLFFFILIILCLNLLPSTQAQQNIKSGGSKKLKDINILMPLIHENIQNRKIKHDLIAYDGCYRWKTSNSQHIVLQEQFDQQQKDCASVCSLYLNSNEEIFSTLWVSATDIITNDIIRVEANIRPIAKIEILTRFRTLDVGDVQVFEVIGYDSEGNSFSSLEGVRFDWQIQQDSNYLEFVPLKDSSIKTSSLRKELESFHNPFFYTDMIAVVGLKTGRTKVTATVKEQGYSTISNTVEIQVIEQFVIFPENPIRVLPSSQINYSLFYKPKSNSVGGEDVYTQISLPSKFYNWAFSKSKLDSNEPKQIGNGGIIYSDQLQSKQEGLLEVSSDKTQYGTTHEIFVKDNRSQENIKKVRYTIVEPHHIDFQIKEYQEGDFYETQPTLSQQKTVFENSWHLVKDRKYYIRAEIYDKNNQLIYIPTNDNIQFNFASLSQYFEINVQQNRGQLVVTPKKLVKDLQLTVNLKEKTFQIPQKSQNCHIVLPLISVTPTFVHLPVSTDKINEQQFYLEILGGSLNYQIQSQNQQIIKASQSHRAIVSGQQIGETVVKVSDLYNEQNYINIKVKISAVDSVISLEDQKEIIYNQIDYIYPIAQNSLKEKFSNCTSLDFTVLNNDLVQVALQQNTQNYSQLIESLERERENYPLMKELISVRSLNNQIYKEYIDDKQSTFEKIKKIQTNYQNFGICKQLNIIGLEIGNNIVSILPKNFLQNAKKQSQEYFRSLDIKVLRNIYNIWDQKIQDQKLVQLGQRAVQGASVQPLDYQTFDKVVITPGASFSWKMQGGIDLWPQRESTFFYNYLDTNMKKSSVSILEHAQNKQNTTFTCKVPSSFTAKDYNTEQVIELQTQNQADLRLPKPVKFVHNLVVSCSIPHSIHIYEFNNTSSQYSEEYHEKMSSLDILYIKNNQENYLKVKAFDRNSQLFYNYTSLKFQWSLSDSKFGKIESNQQIEIEQYENDIYQIFTSGSQVTQTNQELVLKVQSNTFKNHKQTFNTIEDLLGLRIINNVILNPHQLRLYNFKTHQNLKYNIKIENGIGPFQVGKIGEELEDQQIIEFKHNQQRNIEIQPLKNGKSIIYADDYKTLGTQRAFAEVIVEDVSSLIIQIDQNLIPEYNATSITVSALGEFGQEFDYNSYQYMEIKLEAELVLNSNKIETQNVIFQRSQEKYNLFQIQGKKKGIYRISAVLYENNKIKRRSNYVEVEVFSQIYTDPGYVVMAPGCELGIQILGGPQDLSGLKLISNDIQKYEKYFDFIEIEEKRFFIIKAKKTFQDEISLQLVNSAGIELSSVSVPFNIQQVTRVKIAGNQGSRNLHQGTQIRLVAELFYEEQQMALQVCDYKIEWESQFENVLKLHNQNNQPYTQFDQTFIQYQKNYELAVNATAIHVGKSEVSFKLILDNNKEIKSASKLIEVISHINHVQPTYITHDDIVVEPIHTNLLMPPNTRFQIHTNKPNYQIELFNTNTPEEACSSDILQQDKFILNKQNNELFANTNKQRISATVKLHDSDLNEYMSINVQTSNIVGIFIENSHTVFRMPLEKEVKLRLHLQDSLGRSFPSNLIGVNVQVSATNPKVVDGYISSDLKYLHIKSKSSGFTLVKVFLKDNPNVIDIFRINVGSVIQPESPVSVIAGGKINFKLSEKSVGLSQLRNWKSLDTSVLNIDAITGQAHAIKQGEALIEASDGSSMAHQARVIISKISEITQQEGPLGNIITDMPRSQFFQEYYSLRFQVTYQDPQFNKGVLKNFNSQRKSGSVNNDLYFICSIQDKNAAKWFEIKSQLTMDEEGNQTPYCIITLASLSLHKQSTVPAPDTVKITTSLQNQDGKIQYQQHFDYRIQWLFKSREYNENLKLQEQVNDYSYNNNANNQNTFQQQQQQQQQFNQNQQQNEVLDQENVSNVGFIDYIIVLLIILVSSYYYQSSQNQQIDIGYFTQVVILFGAYYVIMNYLF